MTRPLEPSPSPDAERNLAACRQAYRTYVGRVYREHYGVGDDALAAFVADAWFQIDAKHDARFSVLTNHLYAGKKTETQPRILDLASGMGTATLRGLASGFDGYGIEPDTEKLDLMRSRIAAGNLPASWRSRFARAVGEHLPYKDKTFDAILSHQTLEHVQNGEAVLAEMLRVVKPGGGLHLRCPDYRSTFEGHYLIAWLPLMPRPIARLWLRVRGRPVSGLAGIRYVTQPRLIRSLHRAAAHAGVRIAVTDLERERVRARLRERGMPAGGFAITLMQIALQIRRLFRSASELNLWVSVEEARNGP